MATTIEWIPPPIVDESLITDLGPTNIRVQLPLNLRQFQRSLIKAQWNPDLVVNGARGRQCHCLPQPPTDGLNAKLDVPDANVSIVLLEPTWHDGPSNANDVYESKSIHGRHDWHATVLPICSCSPIAIADDALPHEPVDACSLLIALTGNSPAHSIDE